MELENDNYQNACISYSQSCVGSRLSPEFSLCYNVVVDPKSSCGGHSYYPGAE